MISYSYWCTYSARDTSDTSDWFVLCRCHQHHQYPPHQHYHLQPQFNINLNLIHLPSQSPILFHPTLQHHSQSHSRSTPRHPPCSRPHPLRLPRPIPSPHPPAQYVAIVDNGSPDTKAITAPPSIFGVPSASGRRVRWCRW